jgi:hypothetical protein
MVWTRPSRAICPSGLLHTAIAALAIVVLIPVAVACAADPPVAAPDASAPAVAGGSAPPTSASAAGTPSAPMGTPVSSAQPTTAAASGGAPARFATVPPASALPSSAQCATWVRAKPYPENKGANRTANQTTGAPIAANFFSGGDPRANSVLGVRVDGQFTGTTGQILRWAACKWGIDEDLVLAQAAIESWWRQGTLGDWTSDANRCAPGRGLGVDGREGQCPESFGILQNRYPYEQSGWPGIASSTALNADLAYAIWRACFEGYEGWLNTVEHGSTYAAGDAWGCIGRWFSGRWHTAAGQEYVERVRGYLDQRVWESPDFQQP